MFYKKKTVLLAVLLCCVITASAQFRIHLERRSPLAKLSAAELAIENLYVDSVDENKLVEDAIRGMLDKLDPHSAYTTPSETKELKEPLNGDFDGIGVQFNMMNDTLIVIQPVVNGPSEKVGVIAGDRIVAVNDTAIAGVKMPREQIMKRLRGPKGTKVDLTIVRKGVSGVLHFMVIRDRIPLKTVDASYMIRPGIGYIRLESFGLHSPDEVSQSIDSLQHKGMKDLILDLQENGGGYLQSAVQIAQQFLPDHDLIVYTQGRHSPREEFRSDGKGKMLKGKVVVLIDELSASAAEIVTGALQDQDRAIVVGRRSFGKGLVQRPIPFPDGSMIRLTVAHYYTPSGRCIQKPYKKGDLKDYEMDLDHRFKHGEFTNRDSIHFDPSQKYYTLRKHRLVYGGGGIMPDYFVPLDTLQYTAFYRQLLAGNSIYTQTLSYLDSHRKELRAKYPVFESFRKNFVTPQVLMDSIVADGARQKIKPKDDDELQKTIPTMSVQLKALIARDLWNMDAYFEIMDESNHTVQKALQLLTEKNK
ncbi:MAG: S41 family peptidase [Prevotella sp.]|jgi:carboxyl-terminal processing protease|nr:MULTISPECIES: S41 family peptidase [unclassified Prevotella]MCH4215591.1 S41 family peptidase [Prevotella sp.]